MFIRYKRWTEITEQERVRVFTIYGTRYEFWKEKNGICDVKVKGHIERFLNPMDTLSSKFEVAYELYGVQFDLQGHQIQVDGQPDLMPESRIVSTVSVSEQVPASAKPKMSVAERMAKARAARRISKEKL